MAQNNRTPNAEKWDNLVKLFAGANVLDGMFTSEIDSFRFNIDKNKPFTEITEVSLDIIVMLGELKLTNDNKTWVCTPNENNLISIKPMNKVQNIEISDNFKGFAVALSQEFLIKHSFRPNVPIDHLLSLRFFPVFTFEPTVINNLLSIGARIERNFTREVLFKKDLILITMAEFHMEKLIVMLKAMDIDNITSKKSRKMQLCFKFFDLVMEHCKKEHEVNFYAEKLCITTQYLTRILQENYSRSAKEIIHYFLLSEATILLYSDMTLQEISYTLNFTDQSTFGKFFKKQTGVSPTEFREKESNER